MATVNPFDLLGDNDNDDPLQLIASAQQLQLKAHAEAAPPTKKAPAAQGATRPQQTKPAKLPSKPLPPAQAVRETRNEPGRGGQGVGRGGGRGRGRFSRDYANNDNAFSNSGVPDSQGAPEEAENGKPFGRRPYGGARGPYHGGQRGGFSDGEARDGERPRRLYDRRSGTGRGSEFKREGAGHGNWGTQKDEAALTAEEEVEQTDKKLGAEKSAAGEDAVDDKKETTVVETEEKEPEEKEMTLEEYEKLLEEKRKAVQALRTEERKVEIDKELESMQQLSSKKDNDTIFVKLGAGKDKRKEAFEKEEKVKKSVSINEFLKPAEGEKYYNPSDRGRGRRRGFRGGYGGAIIATGAAAAPSIEDPGQFPTLGAK
ncbi:hypothetical protein Ancab_037640 [Ancistrocladus abbreviatus]